MGEGWGGVEHENPAEINADVARSSFAGREWECSDA